ncbi:MAG: glycosyltransferase family 4 protein [Chloroflexi bacterium]|nr:glycosyltransferase family 4 protein [Chloroflexota bacterium]
MQATQSDDSRGAPSPRKRPRLLIVSADVRDFMISRQQWACAATVAGYDVHVALPADVDASAVEAFGWPVHRHRFERANLRPDRVARAVWSLWRLYRVLRPDIVQHVHAQSVVLGTLASRIARVPAVVNSIGGLGIVYSDDSRSMRMIRAAYNLGFRLAFSFRNQRITVQNRDDAADLGRLGADAARTTLVPGSGVELDRFAHVPPPQAEAPVVVFVNRMMWTKGVREFVEAARLLRDSGARFLLIGGLDERNPDNIPQEQVDAWASESVVEYLGHRNDVPELIANADIVCVPTFYREGIPRIVLEAAAVGRPVVATDVPGCRDAVRPGETGLLVPPRDAERLAEALRALIEDRETRERMGRAARDLAEREFSTDRVVEVMMRLYRELAPPPAPAG